MTQLSAARQVGIVIDILSYRTNGECWVVVTEFGHAQLFLLEVTAVL